MYVGTPYMTCLIFVGVMYWVFLPSPFTALLRYTFRHQPSYDMPYFLQ